MDEAIRILTPKGERLIGKGHPCFIIAEMSGNHNQNYETACEIIKNAAQAGADAIKIQTYTPDTLTIDCDKSCFIVKGKGQPEIWQGQKLYDLYKTAFTPWEWTDDLKKLTESLGMTFFSTPYDSTSVDFLEKFDIPLYKIASYEVTDTLLLEKVAKTGKPVIVSVGFAKQNEISEAVDMLRSSGAKDIIVLFCVTAYIEKPILAKTNLRTMLDLKEKYGVVVGFSDNNGGIEIPVLAAAMGASVIEKHFTLARNAGGPDASFSIEPNEFADMVKAIRHNELIMGQVSYGSQSEQEKENEFFRRSLFVVENMKKGEKFTPENIRSIRPSIGLSVNNYYQIIGRIARQDIEKGTPLSWDLITQ